MPRLIIMRGVSGSGKTTMALNIMSRALADGATVELLSTDDKFMVDGRYVFDPKKIAEYHGLTQKQAEKAMAAGVECVIIDNTNCQKWEMKPYVELAVKHNYTVEFHSPPPVSFDELMERQAQRRHVNKDLSSEIVKRMLDRFESDVTVASVLASSR